MKISKQRLVQIIREELSSIPEENAQPTEIPSSDAPVDDAKTSDAKTIISKLPTIDLPNEYLEILMAVLNHDVDRKDVMIKKAFGPTIGNAILTTLAGQ